MIRTLNVQSADPLYFLKKVGENQFYIVPRTEIGKNWGRQYINLTRQMNVVCTVCITSAALGILSLASGDTESVVPYTLLLVTSRACVEILRKKMDHHFFEFQNIQNHFDARSVNEVLRNISAPIYPILRAPRGLL